MRGTKTDAARKPCALPGSRHRPRRGKTGCGPELAAGIGGGFRRGLFRPRRDGICARSHRARAIVTALRGEATATQRMAERPRHGGESTPRYVGRQGARSTWGLAPKPPEGTRPHQTAANQSVPARPLTAARRRANRAAPGGMNMGALPPSPRHPTAPPIWNRSPGAVGWEKPPPDARKPGAPDAPRASRLA